MVNQKTDLSPQRADYTGLHAQSLEGTCGPFVRVGGHEQALRGEGVFRFLTLSEGGGVSPCLAGLFIDSASAAAVRKVLADCQRARLQLDSHGFADLDAAVAFQCALASADTSAARAALRAKWNMGERGRAVGVHGDDLDGGGAIKRTGD